MTIDPVREAQLRRYSDACHAMQTGVAFKMEKDPADTSPKHLRVGVNSAMVEHAALVQLLIDKGIITQEEHLEALCVAMEREATDYEAEVGLLYGRRVTLR